jgi:hypothetical protein
MMRVFTCLLVTLSGMPAAADPSFEAMVADAELIAHCQVTEGGTLGATVRVIDVLKGEAPRKPFLVGGFNQHNRPPDRLEAEAFRQGEEYLLFLRKSDHVHAGAEIPDSVKAHLHQLVADGVMKKEELPEQRRYYERPIYASGYRVTSPTTGDFPVADGRLQGDWYRPSNPRTASWLPSKTAFALIRGLVASQAEQRPKEARGVLARQLSKDLVSAIALPAESREMRDRVGLFSWLMCAQGAYGEPRMQSLIEHVIAQDALAMRLLAARALRSLPESRATIGLISPLLVAPESEVQAEAADSLVHGDFSAVAGALLVQALPTSHLKSGRAAMIRGITHFKLQDLAHDALLDLIRAEQLNAEIVSALRDHFRQFPSDEARDQLVSEAARSAANSAYLFIDLLFADDRPRAQAVLRSKMMSPGIPAEDRVDWLFRYYQRYGVSDPIFGQALVVLQKQRKPQAASEQVLALRMLRILSIGDDAAAAHLRANRPREFSLVDCVERMLHHRPDHALSKPALLYLLKHHPANPQAMACALLLPDPEVLVALQSSTDTEGLESRILVLKALRVSAARSVPVQKRIAAWLLLLERAGDPGMKNIFWAAFARSLHDDADSATHLGPPLRSLITRGTSDTIQALTLLKTAGVPLSKAEAKSLAEARDPQRHWASIFAGK